MNKDIRFSYYSGNIYKPNSIGNVTLEEFIQVHKFPTNDTLNLLKLINEATKLKNLKEKRILKQQLYTFTPSVIVFEHYARKYNNIHKWTGLMQIDFDCIETEKETIQIKEHVFENYKEIICAYISPSKLGVKCILKTIIPKDKEHYKALHQGMVNIFKRYNYLDLATNNAMLPLFLSADPNILWREEKDCPAWAQEDWIEPTYVELIDTKPNNFKIDVNDEDYNLKKVIRITTRRINDIFDNGHPQLRSTALILGSRVAAGYINESQARDLIINLIHNSNYLQKGITGYTHTAMWSITNGMSSPKYFKD